MTGNAAPATPPRPPEISPATYARCTLDPLFDVTTRSRFKVTGIITTPGGDQVGRLTLADFPPGTPIGDLLDHFGITAHHPPEPDPGQVALDAYHAATCQDRCVCPPPGEHTAAELHDAADYVRTYRAAYGCVPPSLGWAEPDPDPEHARRAAACTCGLAEQERTGHAPQHADWCEVPTDDEPEPEPEVTPRADVQRLADQIGTTITGALARYVGRPIPTIPWAGRVCLMCDGDGHHRQSITTTTSGSPFAQVIGYASTTMRCPACNGHGREPDLHADWDRLDAPSRAPGDPGRYVPKHRACDRHPLAHVESLDGGNQAAACDPWCLTRDWREGHTVGRCVAWWDDHRPGYDTASGEGRWCPGCEGYVSVCCEDHCMDCGAPT